MRRTVKDFREAKGKRLVYLTAYDYPTARLAEAAGVDALLVGDSLGMVVLGYPSTVPVTLEEILHHTKAARRGPPKPSWWPTCPTFPTPPWTGRLRLPSVFLRKAGRTR